MIEARKVPPADEGEGTASDEDQRVDPREESKDSEHILQLRKNEENLPPPRMPTRQSQKGIHSHIYNNMPIATIEDQYFDMMHKDEQSIKKR